MTKKRLLTVTAFTFILLIILFRIIGHWSRFMTGPLGIGLPSKMVQFDGSFSEVTFLYPESWAAFETRGEFNDDELIVVIGVPGHLFPSFSIARKKFNNSEYDQVVAWGVIRTGCDRNFCQILSQEQYKTDYYQGILYEYSWRLKQNRNIFISDDNIHCMDWFILDGNNGYSLSICSELKHWDKVRPVFMEMTNSFQVK